MIKIEKVMLAGFEPAIRGMRNPKNSWDKSDSNFDKLEIGPNDLKLMKQLAKGGPVHAKYRRMIEVWADVTAPLYWWKEFDTYKVGTVADSCSTMHKIADKPFTLEDFSCEHLIEFDRSNPKIDLNDPDVRDYYSSVFIFGTDAVLSPEGVMEVVVYMLERARYLYLKTKDKRYWWQMIQLLPSSYNQKRTVMLSYEVLHNIYTSRKDHKLDEWHDFCDWIKTLPYSEVITMEDQNE